MLDILKAKIRTGRNQNKLAMKYLKDLGGESTVGAKNYGIIYKTLIGHMKKGNYNLAREYVGEQKEKIRKQKEGKLPVPLNTALHNLRNNY